MSRESITIVHPAAIRRLTERSWNFSYKILWKRCMLNDYEVTLIKGWIDNYYWAIEPMEFSQKAEDHFNEFCKRAIEAASKIQFSDNFSLFREKILSVPGSR
jgi:hypothetical protein